MLILVHFDHFKGILASSEGSVGGNKYKPILSEEGSEVKDEKIDARVFIWPF